MSKLTYERAKQLYTPYDKDQMYHLCALRDVEIDRLRAENAKLRSMRDTWQENDAELRELANSMVDCFQVGARTGEGIDRQWCRELFDSYSAKLGELDIAFKPSQDAENSLARTKSE